MTVCKVYRSERKPETYLYLAAGREFNDLPEPLQKQFGEPAFVMQFHLDEGRKLARVDADAVRQALATDGYYLQLPPKLPIEEEIARRFS